MCVHENLDILLIDDDGDTIFSIVKALLQKRVCLGILVLNQKEKHFRSNKIKKINCKTIGILHN